MTALLRPTVRTVFAPIPEARNAKTKWVDRTVVRLELYSEDGLVGLGEAAPLPGRSPERVEAVRRALATMDWPSEAPEELSEVEALCATLDPGLPSARFAVETACLDLLGRRLQRPVWALLKGRTDPPPARVPVARVLWAEDEDILGRELDIAAAYRVPVVKLKVGRPGQFERELRWLARIRNRLGDVELRLDANQAFSGAHVAGRLAELLAYRPAFVEEPTGWEALAALETEAPLAADESLCGPEGQDRLEQVLGDPRFVAVILKPSLLGGILPARAMAERAMREGRTPVVSHLLEGPVARAAAGHLALMLSGIAAGLGDHPALAPLSDTLTTPWIDPTGIEVPELPGLGLEIAW